MSDLREGDDAVPTGAEATTAQTPPSADVVAAADAPPLPGVHRGGFSRLPTEPVGMTTASVGSNGAVEADVARDGAPAYEPRDGSASAASGATGRGLGTASLAFSILGLAAAFFVGWAFPLGVVAIVLASLALRRPLESRLVAGWSLGLGILSVVYSAGWLVWAATHANALG